MVAEQSLHKLLEQEIKAQEAGKIIFPANFLHLGSPEALHMAFSRLNKQQFLKRLGKGIYLKPKEDPLLGPVLPSLEDIAKAVAENESVIIRPTGAVALNKLGLSTQVPMKVVYLTNGSRRRITIGRSIITFKPTTPKNLAAKSELVFLAIQALIELGPERTTEKVKDKLRETLRYVHPLKIREDAKTAPQFACVTLNEIANKFAHHD